MSMLASSAPSIRTKASSLAPASTTAMRGAPINVIEPAGIGLAAMSPWGVRTTTAKRLPISARETGATAPQASGPWVRLG